MRDNWDLKRKRYLLRGLVLVSVSILVLAGLVSRTLLSFEVVRGLVTAPPPAPSPGTGVSGAIPEPLVPGHEVLSFLLDLFPPLDLQSFNRGDQVGLAAVFILLLGVLFLERSKTYRFRILNARRTEEEKNH
jgi:hypothetical protein